MMEDETMKTKATVVASALMLLLLAACGSMNDVYGNNPSNSTNNNEVRGTVDSVDMNSHSILLRDTNGSMLSSGGYGGGSVRVYFDDRTSVNYQGQNYRPEDLERGDQVDVRVSQSGNRLVASSMDVIYNVSSNSTSYPNSNNGTYGTNSSTIRGTVRNVDTASRLIELESTNWISGFNSGTSNTSRMYVQYDSNTRIDVSGQLYPVTNLERGDVIEVGGRDIGNSTLQAQRITLVRDIRR